MTRTLIKCPATVAAVTLIDLEQIRQMLEAAGPSKPTEHSDPSQFDQDPQGTILLQKVGLNMEKGGSGGIPSRPVPLQIEVQPPDRQRDELEFPARVIPDPKLCKPHQCKTVAQGIAAAPQRAVP